MSGCFSFWGLTTNGTKSRDKRFHTTLEEGDTFRSHPQRTEPARFRADTASEAVIPTVSRPFTLRAVAVAVGPADGGEQGAGDHHDDEQAERLRGRVPRREVCQMPDVVDEMGDCVRQVGDEHGLHEAPLEREGCPREEEGEAQVERAHVAHEVLVVGPVLRKLQPSAK